MEGLKPGKMLEKFLDDRRGISAMQDAVLFCVMVSIAGAVLVPAFTSTIPRSTHQEVEQQKMAEETLISLLSTRCPSLQYSVAEEGVSIRQAIAETPVFKSLNSFATNRVILHQPYGTLIAECLASQFYLFGDRINPASEAYDAVLKEKIQDFFNTSLGSDYEYHLTARWQPLTGIPIGGNLSFGYPTPSDAATAKTQVLMPFPPRFKTGYGEKLFSKDLLDKECTSKEDIQQIVEKYQRDEYTSEQAEERLFQNISHDIAKLYLSGYEVMPSIINLTQQYCWGAENTIRKQIVGPTTCYYTACPQLDATTAGLDAIDTVLNQTTGGMVYRPKMKEMLNASLAGFSDTIREYDNVWANEYSGQLQGDDCLQKKPATLMNFTWKLAEEEIESNDLLEPYVEQEVEQLLSSTPSEAGAEYIDWLYQMVDIYHAEVSLSIWRA